MPTHDYIISNGTGAAVRADINSALSAIVSLNSNPTDPAAIPITTYAYQLWADTTNGLLKIRNSANTAWITLRQLDGDFSIVAVEDGLVGTPSITFTNDLNTGVFRPGNDQLAIVTAGARRLLIDSTGALTIDTGDAEIYGVRVGRGGGAVSSNTAAGSLALNANTIGAFNTAVGKNALTLNLGGTDNTAMGSSALGGNTSGIGNTAIGLQSLYTNSTANYNTAVGLGALFTNNAANNTAVGVGALKFNTSGTTNTALGTIALENNTLGSNNICLGYNSGSSLTTGSNNTIIGQIPGTAALADTLILGIGSTERLRITSTNTLNFVGAGTAGSTQTVSLSGSAPINSLVLDSSGRLGLGTSSPQALLNVHSQASAGDLTVINLSTLAGSAGSQAIYLGAYNSNAAGCKIKAIYNYGAASSTSLAFETTNSLNILTEALRIDSSQRVGIGTTSPGGILDISGTGDQLVRFQSSAAMKTRLVTGNSDVAAIEFSDGVAYRAKIQVETSDAMSFYTGGITTEVARLDSSGRLLVGTATARANFFNSTISPGLQVEGALGAGMISAMRTDSAAALILGYTPTAIQGNSLGIISFQGSDGSEHVEAARIFCEVDNTPGANVMPGRLMFSTNDGTANAGSTERMRIGQLGFIKASNTGTYANVNSAYHEINTNQTNLPSLSVYASSASFTSGVLDSSCATSASTAFSLIRGYSGNGADLEFNLRGDGNAFADGTWTGGGADYAEYFEWSDDNPDAEDRRGISVVLDGNKIREAIVGEDPIGVISGNPSVVGDAAWNKWSGKYLRDDFGTYIQEDYEVEDEDGNTVVQQRRKLNPAYDSEADYIPREQRHEWDCVGLMGKLRIRKGQPTGSRWIKMRDISDSVEEWLVR